MRAFVQYNARDEWGWLDDLPAKVLGEVDVQVGDLRDGTAIRTLAEGCDRIFHLGALIGIPYSYVAPSEYVATNISGTLHVLQAARAEEVDVVVHTSTSEVYGTARYVPIDEAHPLQGQSPYSASKIGADNWRRSFALSFGVPVVTVRPFRSYGPRQSARAVIPTIVTQALSGPTVRLGSLDPVGDLTYVEDTVDGMLRAARTPDAIGEVVNLGKGAGVTVGDLAATVFEGARRGERDRAGRNRVRPARSEVMELVCDNSKAHTLLGWEPTTQLPTGLERVIDFLRTHLERYRPDLYTV